MTTSHFFGCTMVSMVSNSMVLTHQFQCYYSRYYDVTASLSFWQISHQLQNRESKKVAAAAQIYFSVHCTPFFTFRHRRFMEEICAVALFRWSFFLNANVLIHFVLFQDMNEHGYRTKPNMFRQKISFVCKSIGKR